MRPAGRLVEVNEKGGFVRFQTDQFPHGIQTFSWEHRYMSVAKYMGIYALGPRMTSEKEVKWRVREFNTRMAERRNFPNNRHHNCGNCLWYDAPFERCQLSQNEKFTGITPDQWCADWKCKHSRNWRGKYD